MLNISHTTANTITEKIMWVILIFAVTILSLCWILKRNGNTRLPNGPPGLPILGNTLQVNAAKFHFNLEEWAKQFGPIFKCNIMRTNMVVLSSPELIRKAFASEKYGKIFNDRPESFIGKYCSNNYSGMIVGRYGETLFKMRKVFHTALHLYGDGVPKFENAVKSEIENLIQKIRNLEGKDFDPSPVFERSLGNLVSILVCGETMSDSDAKIIWDFVNASNESLNPTVEFFLFNLPFLRFIPGKYRRIYHTLLKTNEALCERYLRKYQGTYEPGVERGLVDAFIKLQREAKEKGATWFDDDQMKGMINAAIGGSLITTISALTSIFLAFINNVSCTEKIYQEIVTVVGKSRLPNLNDKAKMPYTEAAIMECLRLANIVPIIMPHNCLEDCEFEGYQIPKDTRILAHLWYVNRDPSIWGDPDVFRPERFLDANGNLLPPENKIRQAWLLFGVGRRNCVGEVMARSRMFLYVTSLIQKFKFLPPKKSRLVQLDARNFSSAITVRPPPYICRAEVRI